MESRSNVRVSATIWLGWGFGKLYPSISRGSPLPMSEVLLWSGWGGVLAWKEGCRRFQRKVFTASTKTENISLREPLAATFEMILPARQLCETSVNRIWHCLLTAVELPCLYRPGAEPVGHSPPQPEVAELMVALYADPTLSDAFGNAGIIIFKTPLGEQLRNKTIDVAATHTLVCSFSSLFVSSAPRSSRKRFWISCNCNMSTGYELLWRLELNGNGTGQQI